MTIIISLLGGLWASTSVVFANSKIANERRDAVLLGTIDKVPLSNSHKKIILWYDWMPMALTNTITCILFSIFLFYLPKLVSDLNWVLKILCYGFAIIPSIGAVGLIISTFVEYKAMAAAIKESSTMSPNTN
jgi:hypothetical protein